MGEVITNNLDLWTSAILNKSTAGRGSNGKQEAYGIKKLRELILEFAVRGKLLPQDQNDEPASVLLEKIAKEKATLIKEKKIQKPKALPEISAEEIPHELPTGWEWVRLQEVTTYIQRGKGPKYADDGNVRVVSQKCIQWAGFDITQARYVDDDSLDKYQPERYLLNNDLLWNSTGTGTVGRINVLANIDPEAIVADSHVTVIRPLQVSSNFLWCYIAAPGIQLRFEPEYENSLVSGTTKQVELNTSAVIPLVVPIPPLAEQNRIVTKVDELMALCDQLERQQIDSTEAHQTLVETLLVTLTNVESAEELTKAWSRIADHIDSLFTTDRSIDQLKQTVLQLAVMGRLVPQNPNDEPASALMEKVEKEKERLIKAGEMKKQKSLPDIAEQEIEKYLPESWGWVRLGDLVRLMDAGWSPACPPEPSPNEEIWGVLKTTAVQVMQYLENENKVLAHNKVPKPKYEVHAGDILITRAGPKNRVAISCLVESTRPKLMISDKIIRFHLVEVGIFERYISICLNAGITAEYLEGAKSGMAESQMNISQDKLRLAPIPLCPLEEQKRIIGKVDELMALCNALKECIADSQAIQIHLADAIVEGAVN